MKNNLQELIVVEDKLRMFDEMQVPFINYFANTEV